MSDESLTLYVSPWMIETGPVCGTAERASLLAALQVEQQLLPPQPAPVPTELPVLVHDAVTGDENREPILTVRVSHRPLRTRRADRPPELLVRVRLAVRDLAQRVPHLHLKRRSRIHERHRELAALPLEVLRGQTMARRLSDTPC